MVKTTNEVTLKEPGREIAEAREHASETTRAYQRGTGTINCPGLDTIKCPARKISKKRQSYAISSRSSLVSSYFWNFAWAASYVSRTVFFRLVTFIDPRVPRSVQ